LRAYADPAALKNAVARFRAGERKGIPSMWMLVNVEMWLRSLAELGAAARAGDTPAKRAVAGA
jgi:hypothetical protein